MTKTDTWYLEQRGEALAYVLLTRSEQLAIAQQQTEDETGLDFRVEILKNGHRSGRLFGVIVKSILKSSDTEILSSQELLDNGNLRWLETLPFPVCLFLFIMQTDEGFYRWLTEPFVAEDGRPKLTSETTKSLERLNSDALDTLITHVDRWYDSLSSTLAA
jgi:hypothetical protein